MSKRRPDSKPTTRAAEPATDHSRWLFAVLGLGTVALYWPSVGNGLTNRGDLDYVTNNPFASLGASGLVTA